MDTYNDPSLNPTVSFVAAGEPESGNGGYTLNGEIYTKLTTDT